jgi:hypothetical protein
MIFRGYVDKKFYPKDVAQRTFFTLMVTRKPGGALGFSTPRSLPMNGFHS